MGYYTDFSLDSCHEDVVIPEGVSGWCDQDFFEFMSHNYPAGMNAGAAYDFSEEGYKWFVELVKDHVEKIKSIESGD